MAHGVTGTRQVVGQEGREPSLHSRTRHHDDRDGAVAALRRSDIDDASDSDKMTWPIIHADIHGACSAYASRRARVMDVHADELTAAYPGAHGEW